MVKNAVRLDTVGKGDRRYLLQKKAHGTWYAVVEVPVKLRDVVGKPRLIQSLQTSDLREAQSKRWAMVAAFKAAISASLDGAVRVSGDLTREAQEVREQLLTATAAQREMIMEGVAARIDHINARYARPRIDPATREEVEALAPEALQYAKVVSGEAEAIDTYLDRWLAGTTYAKRTKADVRTAVQNLDAWLKEVEKPAFLSKIDDRVASDFRDLGLIFLKLWPTSKQSKCYFEGLCSPYLMATRLCQL